MLDDKDEFLDPAIDLRRTRQRFYYWDKKWKRSKWRCAYWRRKLRKIHNRAVELMKKDFGLVIAEWLKGEQKLNFLSTCCQSSTSVGFVLKGETMHSAVIFLHGAYNTVGCDNNLENPITLNIADPHFFEQLHEHLIKLNRDERHD